MFIYDCMPVKPMRITSHFGFRNTGIKGATTYHKGIDLGRNWDLTETPIYAVKDGKIVRNEYNRVRGFMLIIKHDSTYSTLYQHLKSKPPFQIGELVKAGQVIGIMGNTSSALTIAEHLHFELWENGYPIDPETYMKGDVLLNMTEKELREIIRDEIKSTLNGTDSAPSNWAKEDWEQAEAAGITDGTRPQGYTTREQVITMISRTIKD